MAGLVSYKTVLFAPGLRPGAAPQGRVAAERSGMRDIQSVHDKAGMRDIQSVHDKAGRVFLCLALPCFTAPVTKSSQKG